MIHSSSACGICDECRGNMPNFCRNGGIEHAVGIFKDGGFAQYCKVRTSLVFKLKDDLRFEQGKKFYRFLTHLIY